MCFKKFVIGMYETNNIVDMWIIIKKKTVYYLNCK